MSLFFKPKRFFSYQKFYLNLFLLALVFCLLYLVLSQLDLRIDFTKDKKYTLSNYTKELIGTLDDKVIIRLYHSKQLPVHIEKNMEEAASILNEFSTYSNHMLDFKVIKKENTKESATFLYQLGIPKFQANVVNKDQLQITEAFCGLIIYYEDKKELIPVLHDITTLEYDTTLAIKRLVKQNQKPLISIFSEQKPLPLHYFVGALSEQYELKFLGYDQEIPSSSQLTFLISPSIIPTASLEHFKAYFDTGGQGIVLIDSYEINGLTASKKESNINDLLYPYGVSVNTSLLADIHCERARFQSEKSLRGFSQSYFMQYKLWPSMLASNFEDNHPALEGIPRIVLPWSSPLSIDDAQAKHPVKTMIQSGQSSWEVKTATNLSPAFIQPSKTRSHFPMVGLIQTLIDDELRPSLLVIGGSHIIHNAIIAQFPNNLHFMLNMVDWMFLKNSGLSIPRRIMNDFPLKAYTEDERYIVKWGTLLIIPVLFILIFLFVIIIRRNKYEKK